MYQPKDFAHHEFASIRQFIQQYPLATVIVIDGKTAEICPMPLLWQADDAQQNNPYGCLIGHVAKRNPICDTTADSWQVSFMDAGHYISPNWYPSKAQTHKEVPTWNYRAVHFTVKPTFITDPEQLQSIVATMTQYFEQQLMSHLNSRQNQPPNNLPAMSYRPWSLEDAPSDYIDAMCRAIIGVRLQIVSFEAKFKLSQNKTAENRQGVIAGLTNLATPPALEMAKLLHQYSAE